MKLDALYLKDNNFHLCGLHFSNNDFQRDLRYEFQGGEKKFKLLDTAIPSMLSFIKKVKRPEESEKRSHKRKKHDIIDEVC